jgi:competence ComEA-like helix-hairpin-helix protein
VELVKTLPAQSPLAHKDSTIALARPLGVGEQVDIDRAGPEEIARLPRVGPGLAKRIVADRVTRGPFGSLQGLDRVPGVGPTVLSAIADHAAFSGPSSGSGSSPLPAQPSWPAPPVPTGAQPVCVGAVTSCALVPGPLAAASASQARLSLNTATAAQLDSLPGIGPKRAEAIVRDRDRNGPFPSVEALTRVPGIKPALVARVRQRLQVP